MMQRLIEVPETHINGQVLLEKDNLAIEDLQNCDFGIQIAPDGRVWVCINGSAFLRFRPSPVVSNEINK